MINFIKKLKLKKFLLIEIFLLIFIIILYHLYKQIFLSIFDESFARDFQWQPAKCLFNGINHYSSYLLKDGKCPQFMEQNGEYAHGLYVLLYPFTILEWSKAKFFLSLVNIILVFTISLVLSKKFKLSNLEILLVIFFILYSKVTSTNIFQGQQTILILFFLILPFINNSKYSYIFSGISFFKYNIGYALFLLYLVSKKFKNLLYSLIPLIVGFISYCYISNTKFNVALLQPIQLVLEINTTMRSTFLFSFIKNFLPFEGTKNLILIFIFTLIFNLLFLYKISKIKDQLLKLSCLCILILFSTPHYGHDYILLIPLLIYSVKIYKKSSFLSRFNFLVSIYFLHFYNLVPYLLFKYKIFNSAYVELVILLGVLILNLETHRYKKNKNFIK